MLLLAFCHGAAMGCDGGDGGGEGPPSTRSGDTGARDLGPPEDAGRSDGTVPDGGPGAGGLDAAPDTTSPSEAGTDAAADASPPRPDASPVRPDAPPPPVRQPPEGPAGLTVMTVLDGLDVRALGASLDEGGTLWVVSGEALLVKRSGEARFRRFTAADGLTNWPPISVAGLGPDEAMVGLMGLYPEGDPDEHPPEIRKSGDADRVRLNADGTLTASHIDISSPPGPHYPDGRERLRSVYTIHVDREPPMRGDIWFAADHGFALLSAAFGVLQEHQHVTFHWTDETGRRRDKQGEHHGVAPEPSGHVWFGAQGGVGRLLYGVQEGGQFWAPMEPTLDVWPDPTAAIQFPDDHVLDLALDPRGILWVASERHGLASVDTRTSTVLHRYTVADGLPAPGVRALAVTPDGNVWIGTSGGGIARLDPVTHIWRYYTVADSGLPSGVVNDLTEWRGPGGTCRVVAALDGGVVLLTP